MTTDPPTHADAMAGANRSARKRAAILAAATDLFLRDGYVGTSMDEVTALSGVSKQTVYKHFASKEALFVQVVTVMTRQASHSVHGDTAVPHDQQDLTEFLQAYAIRQLTVVLTPRLMQLRRLVIGEVGRFPELARVLHAEGPGRALSALAAMFEQMSSRGLLTIDDPAMAASHFNWLVMSAPVNDAMLLGDGAIPDPEQLRRHAAGGVRVFLAAYGRR